MKTDSLSQERKKNLRLFLRRMTARKIVLFGLIGTLLFVILALFAPLIATADPNEMAMLDKLADPSSAHWFGTDMYGRDIFSRVVYGAQVSLIIGVTSVLLASIVGCFLGMLAAYNGGIIDTLLMRFCDAFCAIPQIAITTALVSLYGRSVASMACIMGISTMPGFIRMMRASSLSTISSEYILSAKLLGEHPLKILHQACSAQQYFSHHHYGDPDHRHHHHDGKRLELSWHRHHGAHGIVGHNGQRGPSVPADPSAVCRGSLHLYSAADHQPEPIG